MGKRAIGVEILDRGSGVMQGGTGRDEHREG